MIIALSGWARSGKDTVATAFLEAHPEYRRIAFADKLKAVAVRIDPLLSSNERRWWRRVKPVRLSTLLAVCGGDWDQAKGSPWGPALRIFLQNLGVAVREELGESTWVDAALALADEPDIIITDCRFKNEARAVKERGGIVVRIQRPGVVAANDHISEHDLDDWRWDVIIENEDTPAEAARFLSSVVAELEARR